MSTVGARERNNPTKDELDELMGLLLAAIEDGQLVSLVYMLQSGDAAVVDYRGSHEMTEIATREVRARIAQEIQTVHPKIAESIRSDLAKQVN